MTTGDRDRDRQRREGLDRDRSRTTRERVFLVWSLAGRAFAARYAGSTMGWIWSLVSVAIQFALFYVIFSKVLGIRVAYPPDVGFGPFVMSGLAPFLVLQEAVTGASGMFRSNAALVQRVRFPLEVMVIGDTLGRLGHQAIAVAVVFLACLLLGLVSPAGLPWLALGIVVLLMWSVGLALLVSPLGAALPDLREALGLLLLVAFYGAPIVYPLSLAESRPELVRLISANPLTAIVQMMRAGMVGDRPPSASMAVAMTVAGLAVLGGGAYLVRRTRGRIPDLV